MQPAVACACAWVGVVRVQGLPFVVQQHNRCGTGTGTETEHTIFPQSYKQRRGSSGLVVVHLLKHSLARSEQHSDFICAVHTRSPLLLTARSCRGSLTVLSPHHCRSSFSSQGSNLCKLERQRRGKRTMRDPLIDASKQITT
jgi:hypothetical protein